MATTLDSPAPAVAHEALVAAQRLHDARPWSDMDAALRAALARRPDRLNTLQSLGNLAARQGHWNESVLWFKAATAAHPHEADPHVDLALALRQLNLHEEAAAHFGQAVALAPERADIQLRARLHQGTTLDEQGRTDDALACFQDTVQHHPDSADAWAALGMIQRHLHGAEAAEPSFQRALQIDPARPDVIEQFAMGLQEQRRYDDAALVYERLLQTKPDHPQAAGHLMHCKMLGADWTALDQLQQHIEQSLEAGHLAAGPFGLQAYCASPGLLLKAAQMVSAAHYPDRSALLPPARLGAGPKIRIGYVSGEFRNQATSVLLTEVLELHDRGRFEVFAFDNGWDDGSPLRQRINAAVSAVVPIRGLPNLPAAEAIRAHGIDILIDLNGHFGLARSHLFALRPAPIQVNYLGFPGSTGAPYMDYLIADATVIPPEDHGFYAEQVVALPGSYQPNDRQRLVSGKPASRVELGLPQDAFVFCCMNNVYKITPAMFDIWMRLLKRVPGSVLMLYSDTAATQENLRAEAAARGVDGARIFFGKPLGTEQHLARLRLADLFLDTWPYNAHTTGSDALWAGLPVLTCSGPTFPSRVGASLLKAVGLPELVTTSFDQYEALAYRLASEPGLLHTLRAKLSDTLHSSALFDTPRYVRQLENAFVVMAERALAGSPPGAFACH